MPKEKENSIKTVLALGCHPDDIEFMMAGSLFLFKEKGLDVHYMNLANGNCGTLEYSREEIEVIRRKEAQNAAAFLGATWHHDLANDMEVLYDLDLVRKVTAVIRQVAPDIVLVPALLDYMEDHMNTARIGVTATFARGMPNFYTIPQVDPVMKDMALYHALPYGLHDGLSRKVDAHLYVDITTVVDKKAEMLGMHVSQRNWLDDSQRLDSYIQTMYDMSEQVGKDSKKFKYAEGWLRHNPLGYSAPDFKPLEDVLGDLVVTAK